MNIITDSIKNEKEIQRLDFRGIFRNRIEKSAQYICYRTLRGSAYFAADVCCARFPGRGLAVEF